MYLLIVSSVCMCVYDIWVSDVCSQTCMLLYVTSGAQARVEVSGQPGHWSRSPTLLETGSLACSCAPGQLAHVRLSSPCLQPPSHCGSAVMPSFSDGFWRFELRCTHLGSKGFTHGPTSPERAYITEAEATPGILHVFLQ